MKNVSDASAIDQDMIQLRHAHRFAPRTANPFALRPCLEPGVLSETTVAPTTPTIATRTCGTQTTTVEAMHNLSNQRSIINMVTSIIEAHLKSVAVDILTHVNLTHMQYERLRCVLSFTPDPEKEEWHPKMLNNHDLGKYSH